MKAHEADGARHTGHLGTCEGQYHPVMAIRTYRLGATGPDYAEARPFHEALVAANPERLVWGTDWPHPSLASPEDVPDDGVLMDALGDWTPEPARRQAILVDNPARLYGF